MDRDEVITQWREIEREYVVGWCGASNVERPAAALRALLEKQRALEGGDYQGGFTSLQDHQLFVVLWLCKRYGLRTYREKGQKRGTVMVAGPETFVRKVFYPIVERGLRVITQGVDAWMRGFVEACIRDDLPRASDQAAAVVVDDETS